MIRLHQVVLFYYYFINMIRFDQVFLIYYYFINNIIKLD